MSSKPSLVAPPKTKDPLPVLPPKASPQSQAWDQIILGFHQFLEEHPKAVRQDLEAADLDVPWALNELDRLSLVPAKALAQFRKNNQDLEVTQLDQLDGSDLWQAVLRTLVRTNDPAPQTRPLPPAISQP